MTDEFRPSDAAIAEELERIAKFVPEIPAAFRELRNLLALLPDPIAAETFMARAFDAGDKPYGGALGQSSLIGQTPASTPASAIAAVAPGTFGLRNLLLDAGLEKVQSVSVLDGLAHAVSVLAGQTWYATLSPAVNLASADVYSDLPYADGFNNPLRTNAIAIEHGAALAAGTWTTRLRMPLNIGFLATMLPYFTWSSAFHKSATHSQDMTNLTSATVQLRIRNAADSADLATSGLLDFKALATGGAARISCAMASSLWAGGVYLVVEVTETTSGARPGKLTVDWANPAFELTYTGDPTLFIPPSGAGSGGSDDDYLAYIFHTGV